MLARRGVDAPRFRMVAFGGAGPLLGALLAEELAIDMILDFAVSPGAECAGCGAGGLEGESWCSRCTNSCMRCLRAGLRRCWRNWRSRRRGGLRHRPHRIPAVGVRTALAAEMRYDGQGYDVSVPLDRAWLEAGDTARIASAFHACAPRDLRACERGRADLDEGAAGARGRAMARPPVASVQEGAGVVARTSRPVRLLGKVVQAGGAGPCVASARMKRSAARRSSTRWRPPRWCPRAGGQGGWRRERWCWRETHDGLRDPPGRDQRGGVCQPVQGHRG